jgi:hypothetical protein
VVNSFFTFNVVPSGTVSVLATNPSTGEAGVTTLPVAADTAQQADIVLGNAVDFSNNNYLLAYDPFIFDIRCDGRLAGGGLSVDERRAVNNGQRLELTAQGARNADAFPCWPFARLDPTGRQLSFDGGYRDRVGLEVTRKVFTPTTDASYMRYLEVLKNPTGMDLTVRVRISGEFNSDDAFAAVEASTYRFIADGGALVPSIGLVFGGTDVDAPVPATFLLDGRTYSYEWTVTIPAGETRSLLHFLAQDEPTSYDATLTTLLAAQQVAGALDGLSDEEKESIVNFVVAP